MDDARLNTAWHEAAHAVLCVLFDMPFTTVTIVPTDDYAGAVHPDNDAIAARDCDQAEQIYRFAALQTMLYSGQATALLRRGPIDVADPRADVAIAVGDAGSDGARLLQGAEPFGTERETFIAAVTFNTLSLLQVPDIWATINVVAAILMYMPTLASSEVTDICAQVLTEEACKQAAEHLDVLVLAILKLVAAAAAAKVKQIFPSC